MIQERKIKAAIVGPGNIGIDLMEKIRRRSRHLELAMMVGIDPDSQGIRLAAGYGIPTWTDGLEPLLADREIAIVFEATSAAQHLKNAPLYRAAGKQVFDLTPAAVGPYGVPAINFEEQIDAPNINLVTCGGQATTPIVYAMSRVQPVDYAEIVSTISSKSAGPGTRANIDEFTETTARALRELGGAAQSKAIIILNPAEPPLMMRNTIYCRTKDAPDMERLTASIYQMAAELRRYVPGYRLIMEPTYNEKSDYVVCMISVEGSGDYLPPYAGNLDIITCAAVAMADRAAEKQLGRQNP